MELSTIIGMVLAVVALLGGMVFKHVPFSALNNPAAIMIMLVGTTAAVMNAIPLSDLSKIGSLFGSLFLNKGAYKNADTISKFAELAQLVRREGLLSLEAEIDKIEDPFMKRGLGLLTIGKNTEFIEDTLSEEIDSMQLRHLAQAAIFTQAGAYAPTLGVLGAVLGLMAAMENLDNVEMLSAAIAAAFMATVYGIFTGYVLWHPFANKLKRKTQQEVISKTIILQGVMMLGEGITPDLVRENLSAYLTIKERSKVPSAR